MDDLPCLGELIAYELYRRYASVLSMAAFQGWCNDHRSLLSLAVPALLQNWVQSIHPVLLDACTRLAGAFLE